MALCFVETSFSGLHKEGQSLQGGDPEDQRLATQEERGKELRYVNDANIVGEKNRRDK